MNKKDFSLDTDMRELRPPLRSIDAKSFWSSWVYVFLNTSVGIFLFNYNANLHYVITNQSLTFKAWGSLFLVLAAYLAVSLLRNDWRQIRFAMMAGFCLKMFWAVALIFTALDVGLLRVLASMAMWLSLASIQAIVIIYFVPKELVGAKTNGKSFK